MDEKEKQVQEMPRGEAAANRADELKADSSPEEAPKEKKTWTAAGKDTEKNGKEEHPKQEKLPKPPKPPKTAEQLEWEAQNKERFRQNVWMPWLKPIVALVSICLVTSLLLGLTNALTEPIIEQNTAIAAEAARKALLPEADGFTQLPLDGSIPEVTAMYQATNGAGYVIEAYGRGYGGKVPAMVAFDAAGTILGVSFPENSETVGLGQKVREDWFAAQFGGRPSESLTIADIDKIASATVSTGAAVSAVNSAIKAYNTLVGGGVDLADMTPEEVREYLLPGEEFTPLTIAEPNVQPRAWRSDAGNYIIYGEKAGSHDGSIVVAAVAMDSDGVILNLWLDTSGENESYGALLDDNLAFMQSFIGESAPAQVDAVAGVSGTSASVMEAVNNALAALVAAKEAG